MLPPIHDYADLPPLPKRDPFRYVRLLLLLSLCAWVLVGFIAALW